MTKNFEPDALLGSRVITDLSASASGTIVTFAVTELVADADTVKKTLWALSLSDTESAPRQLTFGDHPDRSPVPSPDGKRVAFVSKRGTDDPQIFVLDIEGGGEARQITAHDGGASTPVWSPDGRRIAFGGILEVPHQAHDPRVIDVLHYKTDGVGYLTGDRQLFVIDVDEPGDARQLTEGPGELGPFSWSPDGKRIALVRDRAGVRSRHLRDVWVMNADGRDLRKLTTKLRHIGQPMWSPSSERLVVSAAEAEGDPIQTLWLIDLEGNETQICPPEGLETASFVSGGTSSPAFYDDQHVMMVRATLGLSDVVKVKVDSGAYEVIASGERQIRLLAFGPKAERIAFTTGDPAGPTEVHVARADGSEERTATQLCGWAEDVALPRVERRKFSIAGVTVTGWLWLPPDREPKSLPLLVEVHGGPHSFVELGMDGHPWRHVLTGRGWAVLSLDPTGSSSYGRPFSERLRGQWGRADLPEIEWAVDALVDDGWVDPDRVAIYGKSYGGFMAAYAIGRSNKFRTAIVSAPVANLVSHAGTSDSGYYVTPYDQRAEIHEAWEVLDEASPVRTIGDARGPVLLLQGEDDLRCPLGQSEELFTQLLRRGLQARMVIYPEGDHHVIEEGRPSHRLDYVQRIVAWLEQHARGEEE